MKIPFRNFTDKRSKERWEKSQQHIAEKIIASTKDYIMLSAPTGLGKSLICAMAGYKMAGKINYVCSDKSLQDQLLRDFPEAVVLKGRSNYKCNLIPHLQADSCVGRCTEYKTNSIDCEYYDQKEKMMAANFRILNTHYILFEMNFARQLSGQELIIIDEADTLDLNFIGFVSLQVTDKQVKKYKLGYPKLTVVESWIDWAGEAIIKLKKKYNKENCKNALDEEFVSADKLIKKLEIFLTLVQDDWIYNRHGTYSEFKPAWITKELIDEYLLQHASRFILCSASLPPKEVICDTLQLDITKCDYIEVGSSFKPENRKVYYDPIMDMSFKNKDKYGVMMDAIKAVMDRYPDVKGIIHCNSYLLGEQIMAIGDDRLICHDSKNKEQQLKLFMESSDPLVFVSPSCIRGLSLADDMARFGICPKMPFPNIKDKAISVRLYGSGRKGKIWYNAETGQSVLQMSGRHVRSFTDWGDMHILDSCFGRVKKTLPKWYTEPIIRDFDYGDDDDDDIPTIETPRIKEVTTTTHGIVGRDKLSFNTPKQGVFNTDMTINQHTQESVPIDSKLDYTWDKDGKVVVKDEDYYDY
jgi:Rad3-related DNA helicase